MAEVNCGKLIEMLSQFPKDKPVKILALGNFKYTNTCERIETEDVSLLDKVKRWFKRVI